MEALGTALSPRQAFRTQGAFPRVSSRPPGQSTSGEDATHTPWASFCCAPQRLPGKSS